jgi:hypothetical protein
MGVEAASLVDDLRRRGFTLRARGGDLVVTPGQDLTLADRESLRDRKAEVLAVLAPPETPRITWPAIWWEEPITRHPPPDAVLYYADKDLRPCDPQDAYLWCWSGSPRWFYTSEHASPGAAGGNQDKSRAVRDKGAGMGK